MVWVWRKLDIQKRWDWLVVLQAIQGWQEVFQPKITYSSTKTRNFPKQKHTGLHLIIKNRSCVLDTENKNKKLVKSRPEGHGHSLKKDRFFPTKWASVDLPRSGAWNLHAEEPRPKTPKDVFAYGEFNGELRLIIWRTDCCYLAIVSFVLTWVLGTHVSTPRG